MKTVQRGRFLTAPLHCFQVGLRARSADGPGVTGEEERAEGVETSARTHLLDLL